MRIALIATMIAALTIPAYAQWLGKDSDSGFPQRDAEIAAKKQLAKETDKGYQAAIKNIPDKLPDKKQSDDPWKNLGFGRPEAAVRCTLPPATVPAAPTTPTMAVSC